MSDVTVDCIETPIYCQFKTLLKSKLIEEANHLMNRYIFEKICMVIQMSIPSIVNNNKRERGGG